MVGPELVQLASPNPGLANAGYTAVAYDVRGYGESDKPHAVEAYTLKELAADVVGIGDALGFERFITIGHDWGGPIALTTALLYPDRVYARVRSLFPI